MVSPGLSAVRRQTPYLLRESPLAASGGTPGSLRGVGDLKTVPVEVTHWPLVARLRGNQRGGIPRSVYFEFLEFVSCDASASFCSKFCSEEVATWLLQQRVRVVWLRQSSTF